jgi:hypothetical protein
MASALIHSGNRVIIDQEVEHHSTEYVEAMESGYEEEEISKRLWAILIDL